MHRYRDELGRFAQRPNLETPSEILSDSSSMSPSSHSSLEFVLQNLFAMAQHEEVQPRTLQDYLHPMRTATPSCIMFPPNAPPTDFMSNMIMLAFMPLGINVVIFFEIF